MSDWMIDTIDEQKNTRKLHISHADNHTYSLEVIEGRYKVTKEVGECEKLGLEIKFGWYQGKYEHEFVERSFFLSGRNLEAFKYFIRSGDTKEPCKCGHRYCNQKNWEDFHEDERAEVL